MVAESDDLPPLTLNRPRINKLLNNIKTLDPTNKLTIKDWLIALKAATSCGRSRNALLRASRVPTFAMHAASSASIMTSTRLKNTTTCSTSTRTRNSSLRPRSFASLSATANGRRSPSSRSTFAARPTNRYQYIFETTARQAGPANCWSCVRCASSQRSANCSAQVSRRARARPDGWPDAARHRLAECA
jgi:hypothetical protein